MTSLDGLHPTLMRPRVKALLADPDAKAMGAYIVSAFRSIEHQSELYDEAVRRCRVDGYHCPPGNWVAPPGLSNHGPAIAADGHTVDRVHGFGIAVDVGLRGVVANSAGQWPESVSRRFQAIAARHGLYQRMSWEDWHFEPIADWKPQGDDDMTDEQAAQLARVEAALTDLTAKVKETVLRAADAENKAGETLDLVGKLASSTDKQLHEIRRNVRQAVTLAGGKPEQ